MSAFVGAHLRAFLVLGRNGHSALDSARHRVNSTMWVRQTFCEFTVAPVQHAVWYDRYNKGTPGFEGKCVGFGRRAAGDMRGVPNDDLGSATMLVRQPASVNDALASQRSGRLAKLERRVPEEKRAVWAFVKVPPMPEFMRVSLSGQVGETKGFCIHGDWYTDPSLPEPWSTDWEDWEGLRLFEQTVDGKLKIEKLFKDVFDVPGTVEPLAYVVATGSELYLF
ncbi:hypothetical protein B0H14DRAFT_3152189 [Mycena olivaceomarginata]|nr:hypothetical protein B0H14DRAFT_3152189 [Mycena olivaceomarginata]